MSDPIRDLCNVLLTIAKTSSGSDLSAVVARVKSELDRNGELTQALQTDSRILQINLGQSKGYQVLVEADATAYIGDQYHLDSKAVIKALGQLLDQIAQRQRPVGTPQNLPRSGVVEFVGRAQKLIDLHAQLQQNDRIAITAISGMGGIGKTELALQYAIAQLNQSHYPAGLCWLRSRDREIATQIVTFAQAHLGLTPPDQLEIEAKVGFCWQQWPEGNVLVVLDDVTDYKAIEPYLPPSDPRFKLLITTRLKLGSSVKDFPVEELDEENAIILLKSLVKDGRIQNQLDDAKALCEWVGRLPLALELLGRFLARKPNWTISRLLKALDDKRLEAKALIIPESGMTAKLGVAAALELSWQELNEDEQGLACALGMFAIAPIPWTLVEQCFPNPDPEELEENRDEGLIARSLLKRVGESNYQLHQIVQEYFRIKLERQSDQGQEIKSSFCRVMVEEANQIPHDPSISEIEQLRYVIPHIQEATTILAPWITDEEISFPSSGIARFYAGQAAYIEAVQWQKHCLKQTKDRLESNHIDIATSLSNLAVLYRLQGKYQEAETLHRKAIKISQEQLLTNTTGLSFGNRQFVSIAASFNNLALVLYNQGNYSEAESLYYEVLEISRRFLGESDLLFATGLHNLAELYILQNRYEEAEPLCLKSLNIRQQQLGESHPLVAYSLNNLALFYTSQERYDEAESLCLRSLEICKKSLAKDHPSLAKSLYVLTEIYLAQERYCEAEPLCLKSLEIYSKKLGDAHVETAFGLGTLAKLYSAQKRYGEAERLYLQSLASLENCVGQTHHYTQSIHTSFLVMLIEVIKSGRIIELSNHLITQSFLLKSLEFLEQTLDKDHPILAISFNNVAHFYNKQGFSDEAEALYRRALEFLS